MREVVGGMNDNRREYDGIVGCSRRILGGCFTEMLPEDSLGNGLVPIVVLCRFFFRVTGLVLKCWIGGFL